MLNPPNEVEVKACIQLPDYDLQDAVGVGSYGTVFRAVQRSTGRLVAVKVAHVGVDARRLARFTRETQLCGGLHHPNIVQLLDQGQQDEWVYGVFEYIPGETLKSLLRRQGALPAEQAGQLMAEVLDALDCAHRAGIVHRDLKPENVMITSTGTTCHAKVLDFGISTLVPEARDVGYSDLTMTHESLGTPSYCAPEQLRGELPTLKSDLYAWGLIFLECLTGKPVMSGASAAEIFHQQLSSQEIILPPEIAAHPVGALLRRAVRKNAADRSESAKALWQELSKTRLSDLVGPMRSVQREMEDELTRTVVTTRSFSEKRQVTVLCCSVGVWPAHRPGQAGAVDSEAIELAQREAMSLFTDAATRYGGVLGGSLSDKIVVLFGYPHASDTDARLATMTALDLAALARRGVTWGQHASQLELGVRMGMHTGTVIVSDRELPTGLVLNVAMRLEAEAPMGEILVSETSKTLLKHCAEFADVGELGPQGPGAYLHTYRLCAARERGTAWHGEAVHGHLVGRERESEQLERAWEQAKAGQGSAILLQGEAGIGKSSLVDALRQRVTQAGGRVFSAQCVPELQNSALTPVLRLLREWLDQGRRLEPLVMAEHLQAALLEAGSDVPRVMPIFCSWMALPFGEHAASKVSAPLQRALLLGALVQCLTHWSRQQPMLLVLEDLHWVDPTTVEFVDQLLAGMDGLPLLVVLTSRPNAPLPEWPQVDRLRLQALGQRQSAEVVRQVFAPRRVAADVVDNVVARTDGVPLFVHELTRMLLDTSLEEHDGVWRFKASAQVDAIPVSLHDSLISRFDRLGPARSLLQLAATIGRQFELKLLTACADTPVEATEQALARLLDAGLILENVQSDPPSFVFRHALIRDTAYGCMLAGHAKANHKAVAQKLQHLYPQRAAQEPGIVAHHLAAAGDFKGALRFGVQQIRITQLRSLNDETIAYGARLDEWVRQIDDAAAQREAQLEVNGFVTQALMNKLGWANPQVKDKMADTQALLTQGMASQLQVPHLWAMITYHHVASNRAQVRELSQTLLKIAGELNDDGIAVAACTYVGLAHYSDGEFDDAERVLTQAINGYNPLAHSHHAAEFGFDTRVWALAGRALVRWFRGDEAASSADGADAIRYARELQHIPSLCMALLYQGLGFQARHDKAAALEVVDELLAICAQYGLPAFEGYGQIIRCWAIGDVNVADAITGALWNMGCLYCQTYYRSFAADTLAEQGQKQQALERLDACVTMAQQLNEHMYTAELHLQKAKCLKDIGAAKHLIEVELSQASSLAQAAGKTRTRDEAELHLKAMALT